LATGSTFSSSNRLTEHITNLYKGTFLNFFGDRNFKDDKAMIGGLGQIDGQSFMIVGQQRESILRCVSIEILGWQIRRLYRKRCD
jgi:acetyl-CoA carboxylase carboxyl transferase subunit alpha